MEGENINLFFNMPKLLSSQFFLELCLFLADNTTLHGPFVRLVVGELLAFSKEKLA